MISLTIRFPDEARMFGWVDDMVQCQCLPAQSKIRHEDALDRPDPRYILDGGRDGGRALELVTRTETTVEVVEAEEA